MKRFCENATKMSFLSVIISMLFEKDALIGKEIMDAIFDSFEESLKRGEFRKAAVFVRGFGELANCSVVSVASLFTFYNALVDASLESSSNHVKEISN